MLKFIYLILIIILNIITIKMFNLFILISHIMITLSFIIQKSIVLKYETKTDIFNSLLIYINYVLQSYSKIIKLVFMALEYIYNNIFECNNVLIKNLFPFFS